MRTRSISNPLRLLSLFSGIGAFEKALTNLQIPYDLIGYAEIDKYASASYQAIHNAPEWLNFGDITQIDADNLEDFDLMTWGFPCQDISVAGHQRGLGEGTRSSLYTEGLRILRAKRPRVSIFENVKNLVGKKFKAEFETILKDLEELGYTNYWKVLNAKDYGVPQNRERVFCVSILGEHKPVEWPEPFDNGIRLRDILEEEVDEKYYINTERAQKLLESLDWDATFQTNMHKVGNMNPSGRGIGGEVYGTQGLAPTVTTNKGEGPRVTVPRMLRLERTEYGKAVRKQYENGEVEEKIGNMREYKVRPDEVANTLTNVLKDNTLVVPVLTPDRVQKRQNGRRFKTDGEPMFTITGQDRHGILQVGNMVDTPNRDDPQRGRVYSKEGISPALNTMQGGGLEPKIIANNYRIRKLTPLECWRLMGFTDMDHHRAQSRGISNTQLYKQAGNSIVVQVIEEILRGVDL